MFTRILPAILLATLTVAPATAQTRPVRPASTDPRPDNDRRPAEQPADLTLVSLRIDESKKIVEVTVRLEARIGVRGVPVRLRIAGGGETLFDNTQKLDMPLNATRKVTFTKVDFPRFRAAVAAQPLQALSFLSVTATVDPAHTIGEANEGNNTQIRILAVN